VLLIAIEANRTWNGLDSPSIPLSKSMNRRHCEVIEVSLFRKL
jgi:hypothetical protein